MSRAVAALVRMCRGLLSARVSPDVPAAGRWPFWRVGGLQEPGSVFFSLLNLLAHYCGLKALRRVPVEKRSPAHSWCATATASYTQHRVYSRGRVSKLSS